MAVTTSSAHNGTAGAATLTLNYPTGAAGDVLLIWQSVDSQAQPTISGDLDPGEIVGSISSTGRFRVYRRVRQAGDASVTFTSSAVGGASRITAIAANLTPDFDTSAPIHSSGPFTNEVTIPQVPGPGGPGLVAVWWSFSDLEPAGPYTVLEAPDPDGDVTVGFELRLWEIPAGGLIDGVAPFNPSLDTFVRGRSYTKQPGARFYLGRVGFRGSAAA